MNDVPFLCKDGKYRYIYRIVDLTTNEYYYGQHVTRNLDDRYMGSGVILTERYKKFSKNNFLKYILYFCESNEELDNLEKQLIKLVLHKDKLCLNKAAGGHGGFENIGWNFMNEDEQNQLRLKISKQVSERQSDSTWFDRIMENGKTIRQNMSEGLIKAKNNGRWKIRKGWKHNQSTRSLIKTKLTGSANFCYHKKWMYNIHTNEAIFIDVNIQLSDDWKPGKKPPKHQINENHPTHQYIWIHNDKETKYILKKDFQNYENCGWVKGRILKRA